MNVLFVFTETLRKNNKKHRQTPLPTEEDIPLGISYIASVLEASNHKVDLFITTTPNDLKDFDELMETFKPDVIGCSMVYREFFSCVKIMKHVKRKYPQVYIFAGGAHCTLNPEAVLEAGFDAACVGEGEYPVLELVEQIERKIRPTGIQNFWFRTENGIEKNEMRDYICDLDQLPFPNRRIWQKYIADKTGMHDVIVGRGCPYNCKIGRAHV